MSANKLSESQIERLSILSEELGESQQAIGKILRHGFESFSSKDPLKITNKQKLESELGDVLAAIYLLYYNSDLNLSKIENNKKLKMSKYKSGKAHLHHQKFDWDWPEED